MNVLRQSDNFESTVYFSCLSPLLASVRLPGPPALAPFTASSRAPPCSGRQQWPMFCVRGSNQQVHSPIGHNAEAQVQNHLALISPQQITAIPRCLQVSRVTLRRIPPIRRATATTPVQAPSFLRGQIEGQLERAGERRDSGMAERGGAEEIAVLLSSDARRSRREAASTATRPAQ